MTDFMVIGKFRNKENVQSLVEKIRSKGKRVILIGEPEKPETLYYIFDEYYKNPEEFLKTI